MKPLALFSVLAMLLAGPSFADVTTTTSTTTDMTTPASVETAVPTGTMTLTPDNKIIIVRHIVINSLLPMDPAVLQPVLSSYENRPLTMKELVELQNRINSTLAQNGQTTVQASIGDIGSDTMTIQLANRPGLQTVPADVAEQPSSGVAALGVVEPGAPAVTGTSPAAASPALMSPAKMANPVGERSTAVGDRYWQRFFQSKPATTARQQ